MLIVSFISTITLPNGGLRKPQAAVFIHQSSNSLNSNNCGNLATKEDIAKLKEDIVRLELATKEDIADLCTELRTARGAYNKN